ncbi:aspartate/glutamate racemase family protein [Brevibacterium luteolum]|uniref:aspartate/glutamate racemase family protein n=1 Tax=Brevibacterium luteolum TaxID=199591 RepID=UPI003EEE4910
MPRIAVVNCNTNVGISESIEAYCSAQVSGDTAVRVITPEFGPESAEGYYESFVCAAAMLHALEAESEEFSAIVLAGFGEHGADAMRQRWEVPVVDITEAGPMLACLISRSFGVITTLTSTLHQIRDSLKHSGLHERCVGVKASDVPVASTVSDIDELAGSLVPGTEELIADGAGAIVLGCAGFSGLADALSNRVSVPVVDSVGAGVRMAELMVKCGLTTSKLGPYMPLNQKNWKNWHFGPAQST